MEKPIMDILCFANGVNGDLSNIQTTLIEQINREQNKELRAMMVYAVDDKMIQRFGNTWLKYLIEKHMYNTDTGGNKFYEKLNEYIDNRDYIMLRVSAMILRNGFMGTYNTWQRTKYDEIIRLLNIQPQSTVVYTPYIPHTKYNKPISKLWIIVPIIVGFLCIQLVELFVFYRLNKFWSTTC